MQREEKKRDVMEAEVSVQRIQMKYKVCILLLFPLMVTNINCP